MVAPNETGLSLRVLSLVAECLNAPVNELSIHRVTGDASTRSYLRARARDSSVIIALYAAPFDENEPAAARLARVEAEDPSARLTFANDPCAHIEVTTLFLEAGLPVPRVLRVSGIDGVMLFEDVGDARLQDWVHERSEAEVNEAYRRGLALIVKIQDATDLAVGADHICSRLAFDEAKLRWELGFFFANYFNRYLRVKLDAATSTAVQADFKSLCSELALRPRVLAHRDFHARNLMMHDRGMFIIDHQDARMGPASYDVASLLSDPYTTLPRESINEHIEEFIELKQESKAPLTDVDEFRNELELMTVQRMLKAIGTYASQTAAGNPVYIPYIDPALDRALTAMESAGRFGATRKLLEETRGERSEASL